MKLMLAACGMLAVASCSNDDAIFEQKGGMDLSGKTVLRVTTSDGDDMRSYRDAANNDLRFDEYDVIRVYDKDLKKFDMFESAFEEDKSHYFVRKNKDRDANVANVDDYGFALFGADASNLISYAGWNDGLVALMKISGDYTYTEKKTSDTGKALYKDLMPAFGKVTHDDPTVKNEFGTAHVTMLTGVGLVMFENGQGSGVRRVRATSLSWKGEPTENIKQAFQDAVQPVKQETTPPYSEYATTEGAKPLAGWFEAVLSEEPDTDPSCGMRMITDETGAVEPAKGTSITIKVDENAMATNSDNYVYFPIVPNEKYDLIIYEYSTYETDASNNNNGDWKYAGCYSGKVARKGQAGAFKITTELTCSATTLSEVNAYLKNLDKSKKSMVINFPNKVNSFRVGQNNGLLGIYEDSVLVIPTDWTGEYEVTLNFNGGTGEPSGTGLITKGDDLANKTVKHKDTGIEYQGQTLIPAVMEMQNEGGAKVKVNVYTGTGSTRPVQVNVTKNAGEITLGQNVYGIKAEAGNIVVDASENVLTNSDVTIETAEGKTVNVSVLDGNVATLTQNANGSVEVLGGKVTTLTNNGNGDVTVNKASFTTLTNGENGGAVTIKELNGHAGTLTDNSEASLTITNENSAAYNIDAIITKGKEITITNVFSFKKLQITGEPEYVTVRDYITEELVYEGTKEIEYRSFGKSAIIENKIQNNEVSKKASDQNIKFVSEWDGEKPAQLDIWGSKKQVHAAEGKNVYDIYTAAELAMLLGTDDTNNLVINLHANIDLGEENPWTGIYFEKGAILNGNGKTISHVNIANTVETKGDRKASQYGFGFINEADGALEVSNLTLDGVNTKGLKLLNAENDQISGIGGLVGRINNTGTFEKVTVNGSQLGLTGAVRMFNGSNTTSCKVGGIVGMSMAGGSTAAQGAITIKDCTVDVETITGQWALGGLIGDGRTQNGKITLTNNNVKVGEFVPTLELDGLKEGEFAVSEFYGRIGMLVGCIVDYTYTDAHTSLEISQKDLTKIEDVIVNNRSVLGFTHNIKTVNDNLEKFEGYEYNGVLFVGYSGTKEYVSDGAFSLTINNTKIADAPETVAGLNKFVATKPAAVRKH